MRKAIILALLLSGLTSQAQKLSPWLAQKVQTGTVHNVTNRQSKISQTKNTIDVLVKFADGANADEIIASYDAECLAIIGRVYIVRMPLTQVEALSQDERVLRVEAERAPHTMLDRVPQQIGADKAASNDGGLLPQAFTGKDVVVGIVDAGFDYIHPFFRDGNGNTRVVWAADYMTNKTYTTTSAITAAMHSSDAETMYHGTHVAAIAAGSRVEDADWVKATAYQGIAPEADIAEGAISTEITSAGLSSATSVKAFADIFNYASEQQKPCVINYSMGDAMSFVNSRQLEEEAINTLLATPGRALVVAAGNAGDTKRLAHKPATMTKGGCGVCFNDYEQYGTYFGAELKLSPYQTVTLRQTDGGYKTNKGETTLTTEELAAGTTFSLGSKRITATAKGKSSDGFDVVYITAGLTTTYQTSDRLLITIEGEGDAWIYADPLCAQLENIAAIEGHSLAEDGYSMAWPAMLPQVIGVGNIAHRFQIITMANKYASQGGVVTPTDLTSMESTKGEGFLARSSSVGPTLTGNIKPDVCAPGVNIVSAQNFFIDDDTYYALAAWDIAALDTEYETWGGMSGYFHIMAQTGTSMSAPAVTGAIALWMQADPSLTVGQIKDIIANSSRQPDNTMTYPNNLYGYGEIDAYRGLLYMLGLTAIGDISQHQPAAVRFRVEGKTLVIDGNLAFGGLKSPTVKVYSTDGKLVYAGNLLNNMVSLRHLPSGIYAVQLNTGNRQTTGSTLIRL